MSSNNYQSSLYEGHTRAFRSQSLDPSLLSTKRRSPRRSPRAERRQNDSKPSPYLSPDKKSDGSGTFEVDVNTPVIGSTPVHASTSNEPAPDLFWQTAARRLMGVKKNNKNARNDQLNWEHEEVSESNQKKGFIRNGFMSKAGVAMRILSEKNGRSKIHPNKKVFKNTHCANHSDECSSDCQNRLKATVDLDSCEPSPVEKECRECCSSYEDACSRSAKIVKGIIIPSPVSRFKGKGRNLNSTASGMGICTRNYARFQYF